MEATQAEQAKAAEPESAQKTAVPRTEDEATLAIVRKGRCYEIAMDGVWSRGDVERLSTLLRVEIRKSRMQMIQAVNRNRAIDLAEQMRREAAEALSKQRADEDRKLAEARAIEAARQNEEKDDERTDDDQ